jgi:hypothetical protein
MKITIDNRIQNLTYLKDLKRRQYFCFAEGSDIKRKNLFCKLYDEECTSEVFDVSLGETATYHGTFRVIPICELEIIVK